MGGGRGIKGRGNVAIQQRARELGENKGTHPIGCRVQRGRPRAFHDRKPMPPPLRRIEPMRSSRKPVQRRLFKIPKGTINTILALGQELD